MTNVGLAQPANGFNVTVTGDTGYDIFTTFVEGYVSRDARVRRPEAVYDLIVPAGADLITKFLNCLFQGKSDVQINVRHAFPKSVEKDKKCDPEFITVPKYLIELDDYADKQAKKGDKDRVYRVCHCRPLHDQCKDSDAKVFQQLTAYDDQQKEISPSDSDLLIINDSGGDWRRYIRPEGSERFPSDPLAYIDEIREKKTRRKSSRSESIEWPNIIVNLNDDLPSLSQSSGEQNVWKKLLENPQDVCVVCSAEMLRRDGTAISRGISWEQTIEDVASELHLFDKLKALSKVRHLIVRFGVGGILHIFTNGETRCGKLYFAPIEKYGFYRDPVENGDFHGLNMYLIASLVSMMSGRAEQKTESKRGQEAEQKTEQCAIGSALKSALLAGRSAFDNGYETDWKELNPSNKRKDPDPNRGKELTIKHIEQLCSTEVRAKLHWPLSTDKEGEAKASSDKYLKSEHEIGEASIPQHIFAQPPTVTLSQPKWEILHDAINPRVHCVDGAKKASSDIVNFSRVNVGAAIVRFGHEHVLNRVFGEHDDDIRQILLRPPYFDSSEETPDYRTMPLGAKPNLPLGRMPSGDSHVKRDKPIYVPIVEFGKLTVIERNEIEGLRSIRNSFKNYIYESSKKTGRFPPLSVAVFGPPGSGKSYAIGELAKDINAGLDDASTRLELIEYNVAQFESIDQIGDAITLAATINNEGKIPLIFFDEFDCVRGDAKLGWLKYFLAPMQDGKFYGVRNTIKLARAIFVFAGGVYPNFDAFDPFSQPKGSQTHPRHDESLERQREFTGQKGPDFISRLRGHMDILPVNAEEREIKPIIRRAIVLRGMAEAEGLLRNEGNRKIACIDEDILYALLTIDSYRHGTRSMKAVLQMCARLDKYIHKSSLPPHAQLNMHVDADEFIIRMHRARMRSPAPVISLDVVERRPEAKEPLPKPGSSRSERTGDGLEGTSRPDANNGTGEQSNKGLEEGENTGSKG